jgi:hypothetical protein
MKIILSVYVLSCLPWPFIAGWSAVGLGTLFVEIRLGRALLATFIFYPIILLFWYLYLYKRIYPFLSKKAYLLTLVPYLGYYFIFYIMNNFGMN